MRTAIRPCRDSDPYPFPAESRDRLAAEDERELARRAHAGDRAARDRLVIANLGLVVRTVTPLQGQGLGFGDLMHEGVFGLMAAVDLFDPDRGLRFSTYATPAVRRYALRAIENQGRTIRVPTYLQAIARGRGPAVTASRRQLLAHAAKIGFGATADMEKAGESAESREAEPPVALERAEQAAQVQNLVTELPPRHAEVIRRRFGLEGGPEETLKAVGRDLGISATWTHQVEVEALVMLRERIGEEP